MTTEETRRLITIFDEAKKRGLSDDEIWDLCFSDLTNQEMLQVIEMAWIILKEKISEAVAEGDDPRLLWHIFKEFME